MRVAILHPSFESFGGAEALACGQARELAALGHEVTIVSFGLGRLRDEGVAGVRLTELRRPLQSAAGQLAVFERFTGVEDAVRHALAGADRVIAHHPPASSWAVRAGFAERTVFYCHEPTRAFHRRAVSPALDAVASAGSAPPSNAKRAYAISLARDARRRLVPFGLGWAARDERRAVARVAALWANSAFTAGLARTVYGRADVEIVYPFVGERSARAVAEHPPAGALRVLTRTRLQPIKNVDLLIRAVALAAARGLDLELDVVGDGSLRVELAALAQSLGLGARVRLHGYLGDAASAELEAGAHVFALLPFDEPFGLVFVEAALAGLVVLGPDQGGPREILAPGGFSADASDVSAIAAEFARIRGTPRAELDVRRAALRQSCLERYTAPAFRDRMRELLGPPPV
ncbi:MAG TPA: glycosyltransferase [Polyangiaceae bacterium]|nr:glycosyltransferase [Polyangiaceae bacterium]